MLRKQCSGTFSGHIVESMYTIPKIKNIMFNKKHLATKFFASLICNETPTQKTLTGIMLRIYFEKEEVRISWRRACPVGKIYSCGSVFSF